MILFSDYYIKFETKFRKKNTSIPIGGARNTFR